MHVSRFTCSLLPAALAAGCAATPADSGPVIRDSAGIRIVENSTPIGPAFRLDTVPTFDIGPADGPAAEFISSPVSAVRLDDGRIVAAGWAMTELKFFDARGRWVRTVGRAGGGPGEFEALGFVFRGPESTVITYEPGSHRLQRWTESGEYLNLSPFVSIGVQATAWVRGVFDDGTLVLRAARPDPAALTELTSRNIITMLSAAGPAAAWDSLFSYAGAVELRHPQYPMGSIGLPPFTAVPSFHVRGSRLAFAAGDRLEVELRDASGAVQTIVRRADSPRKVSGVEIERAIEAWVSGLPPTLRDEVRSRLHRVPGPGVRPPVASVWLAGDGRLWVLSGDPILAEPITASVFNSLGQWETDVTMPPGLQINQIDGDGVLGTWTDDDGFRHLRFHRILR